MKKLRQNLKGLLTEIKNEQAIFYILDKNIDEYTYNFLMKFKYGKMSPVKYPHFKVKLNSKSLFFSNKNKNERVSYYDLIYKKLDLIVDVNRYNFKKNNNDISGWNMTLLEAFSIEY
jgi:hypothetical protein